MKVLIVLSGLFATAVVLLVVASFLSTAPDQRPDVTRSTSDPFSTYDPVKAGETLPTGFRQLLPRDAIFPVYDPAFVSAGEIDWNDDTMVIGLALEGEQRAYPVGFLNRREMVIDSVAGIPVLVTW